MTTTKLTLTIKENTYVIASIDDIISIHESGATVRIFNKAHRAKLFALATKGSV